MIRLPEHVLTIGQEIRDLNFQCKTYFVGGLIRDLIISPNFIPIDIDILVDGDVFSVAKGYADKTGGELTIHRKFLTATVLKKDGHSVDFVQARRETYEKPGALPTVSPGDLSSDCLRRDFTINTLLIEITLDTLTGSPKIINLQQGLEDLENKIIRVLHDKSFLDDPTRIFRAFRYRERVKGSFEIFTGQCVQLAISSGALNTISRTRIFNEFVRIADEVECVKIIEELHKANVFEYIFPLDLQGFKSNLVTKNSHFDLFRAFFLSSNQDEVIRFFKAASCSKKFISSMTVI